ncbi:DUF4279 domain-containing protein [Lewinella sp. W8]|uniref:DUF4279 domain-containing protein n=1 Tax=Lewinella sp. W8 TaxID=2528208 RepID=UPI001068BB01|nr:DUF4279 domain-containing protein [Lewinella sp. W8]MTB51172.1 DUF4279 domain-containing protein [Lewinella sp. W8]
MPTVLKLIGDYNADIVLRVLNVKPYEINRKGEINKRKDKKPYESTTCKFDVSELGFDKIEEQIEDAIDFLSKNYVELKELTKMKSIKRCIDLGIDSEFRNENNLSIQLSIPPKLMKLMGDLEMELIVTQYWLDR